MRKKSEVSERRCEWMKGIECEWKRVQVNERERKWMKERASEWKRVQVNERECKWIKESASEWKRVQVNEDSASECRRVQVNERENASEWKSAKVRKSERGKNVAQNMEFSSKIQKLYRMRHIVSLAVKLDWLRDEAILNQSAFHPQPVHRGLQPGSKRVEADLDPRNRGRKTEAKSRALRCPISGKSLGTATTFKRKKLCFSNIWFLGWAAPFW